MPHRIATGTDVCLFKVAIFYESVLGSKELENDRERSWRWKDRSRTFLQERSWTKLAPRWTLMRRWSTLNEIYATAAATALPLLSALLLLHC